MLKKLQLTVLAASAAFYSFNASAAELAGARGTLSNVETALNEAVVKAERMFEENAGKKMSSVYRALDGENPYIARLIVDTDYSVKLKFAGNPKEGKGNGSIPVAKALLGTEILLTPVYNAGDEKITSWECLTNADREVQMSMGDAGTKQYTASFIRDYTKNSYLSLCTYIKEDFIRSE